MKSRRFLSTLALALLPLLGATSAPAVAEEPTRAIARPTVELGVFAERMAALRCEANVLVDCNWSYTRHQCECGTFDPLGESED